MQSRRRGSGILLAPDRPPDWRPLARYAQAAVVYVVGGAFLALWIIASVLGLELFSGRYCEDSSVCRAGSPGWAIAQSILAAAGVWNFIPLMNPRQPVSTARIVLALGILAAWLVVYFALSP
jgi:hypothetical protein